MQQAAHRARSGAAVRPPARRVRIVGLTRVGPDERGRGQSGRAPGACGHGGPELDALTASSRLDAGWSFFKELKDHGRATAKTWLNENYDAIGVRSTLNLKAALA
jgi:hypothetical protein